MRRRMLRSHGTIRIVGLVATIAVTLYVTKLARAALKGKLDSPKESLAAD